MTANLYEAHREWANRPADERFPSLDAMYDFTRGLRDRSIEGVRRLSELELVAGSNGNLAINGSGDPAVLSHWSFGQLAATTGAPASYLRTLPTGLARDCLSYDLKRTSGRSKLLLRAHQGNGSSHPHYTAAAFTGPKYGRIWDADVIAALKKAVTGTAWHTPPARPIQGSEYSGLYASDHDMFAFMVNEEDSIEVGNAKLGKGFFCWNSETGSTAFGLTTFLYNYVCGNHIVWGAQDVQELRIIHRNLAPEHFASQALPAINQFARNRLHDDTIKLTVDAAMNQSVGTDLETTIEYFKPKPFTKKEILAARDAGVEQGEDISTLWGMIQGFTAHAQTIPHIDKRVSLERRAGALLHLKRALN